MGGSGSAPTSGAAPIPGAPEVRVQAANFSFTPLEIRLPKDADVNLTLVNPASTDGVHDLTVPGLECAQGSATYNVIAPYEVRPDVRYDPTRVRVCAQVRDQRGDVCGGRDASGGHGIGRVLRAHAAIHSAISQGVRLGRPGGTRHHPGRTAAHGAAPAAALPSA